MKFSEPGVIGESYVEFTMPSDFARRALYCCPQAGYFYCNDLYDISRESYDWFLICFVCSGSLAFEADGQTYTAGENDIFLLDCHKPHRYYCPDRAEFMWFHFSGCSSADYVEYLHTQRGPLFTGEPVKRLQPVFTNILRQAGSAFVDEHILSREINNILCALATSNKGASLLTSPITPALVYIRSHYSEPIDLDRMADQCMISKPHLIRCFKKELNCTPHDYLLDYRLREAKQMLIGSPLSVEEIAVQCGFNSVSHFSRAFRNRIGLPPSEFRNIW